MSTKELTSRINAFILNGAAKATVESSPIALTKPNHIAKPISTKVPPAYNHMKEGSDIDDRSAKQRKIILPPVPKSTAPEWLSMPAAVPLKVENDLDEGGAVAIVHDENPGASVDSQREDSIPIETVQAKSTAPVFAFMPESMPPEKEPPDEELLRAIFDQNKKIIDLLEKLVGQPKESVDTQPVAQSVPKVDGKGNTPIPQELAYVIGIKGRRAQVSLYGKIMELNRTAAETLVYLANKEKTVTKEEISSKYHIGIQGAYQRIMILKRELSKHRKHLEQCILNVRGEGGGYRFDDDTFRKTLGLKPIKK